MATKLQKKSIKQENRLTQLKKRFDIATLFHIGFTFLIYASYLSMMTQLVPDPALDKQDKKGRQEALEWLGYNIDGMVYMWAFHMLVRIYYFRQRHTSVIFVVMEWSELLFISVLTLLQRFGGGGLAAEHHLVFPPISMWLLLTDVAAVLGIVVSFLYSGYAYFYVIEPVRKAAEEKTD